MRMRWLARLLLPRLRELVSLRSPDMQLDREDGVVYLRRWHLIPRNRWFGVYLHNMIGSDDDVLHDHPYHSVSLVLTDGLRERHMKPMTLQRELFGPLIIPLRTLREGQVVWRGTNFAHQLIVDRPSWTLFLMGPRVREWGFWCPRGWIPWQEYYPQQSPEGRGGRGARRGCGETDFDGNAFDPDSARRN